MRPVLHHAFLPDGKTVCKEIPAQFFRAGHGLQNQEIAGRAHPGSGIQNRRDGFPAHPRNDDIVGFVRSQTGKPVSQPDSDTILQPSRLRVAPGGRSRPRPDICGDGRRAKPRLYQMQGQVGMIGADIGYPAARPHHGRGAPQAFIEHRGRSFPGNATKDSPPTRSRRRIFWR